MKEKNASVGASRIVCLDYLRVLATFAVIVVHISAQNWVATAANTFAWQTFNFYDGIVSWSVPMFVMISGAVFLSREFEIKTIFSKYILRLVTAFLCWGGLYALILGGGKKQILLNTIHGHYHMWFIPMIIGLYLCIPMIKRIADSETVTKYFLAVAFVITFFLPQIVQMTNDFGGETAKELIAAFDVNLKNMNCHFVLGYTCYFIAGFYLSKTDLSKKVRRTIYLFGVAGFTSTVLLNAFLAIKTQAPAGVYYSNFTVNVLAECLAVFVWMKYHFPNVKALNAIMSKLSKYSFGAYLVHILIIEQLNNLWGLNSLSFCPIVSVPVISIVVFILSFAISGFIHQIPILKKYIV